MEYHLIKPETVDLKNNPNFNEKWVQEIIAKDSSILGLGSLILRDKERHQSSAGKLDLLFEDENGERRYEVEVQLGKTDESHIIRTIEYWDNERKRYPQYDHVGVIIAEDVNSRFLNVINLFNGHIPIIALKMNAYLYDDKCWLTFTKVLDEVRLGDEYEEEKYEPSDRNYWEARASVEIVGWADEILKYVKELTNLNYQLNYTQFYIGLTKNGIADNFIWLQPQKRRLRLGSKKIDQSIDIDKMLEASDLDFAYKANSKRYVIIITGEDIQNKKSVLFEWIKMIFEKE